jgi:hypothetical protein
LLSKKIVSLAKKNFKHVKILTIVIDYFLQNKEIVAKNISVFGGQIKRLTKRRGGKKQCFTTSKGELLRAHSTKIGITV